MLVESKHLEQTLGTMLKLLKNPKLTMENFSQLAFVNYQQTLYLLGFGKDLPNSTVTLLISLVENDSEDFVFYANVNDFKRIFGTLGDTIDLNFTETHLKVYSNNDGMETKLTVVREQALTREVEKSFTSVIDKLVESKTTRKDTIQIINREPLLKKLDNLIKIRALDRADLVGNIVFNEDTLSTQQFSYAAIERLHVGITARIPIEVASILQLILKNGDDETVSLNYDKSTMVFEVVSEKSYIKVSNISDTTQDLSRFQPTQDRKVSVNKNRFLNASKVVRQYLGDYPTIYLIVENDTLTITNTMNIERIQESTTPKVTLPISREVGVLDGVYGVSANELLGLVGILDTENVHLYFENNADQSLLYVQSEDTYHFMYMDIFS